ncbi:hypothetical protein KFE25_001547 [Diacronema lutheri]|uniref:Alpha 1,4-glycosyltransferase domain-containing protein n=1 Tax=Diacronema lutheri TaxID=2081491 RepID=A0A8J6C5L9_DIALT|nr:hypothetical protein KFE25_001547 [Diacronema lutheri]
MLLLCSAAFARTQLAPPSLRGVSGQVVTVNLPVLPRARALGSPLSVHCVFGTPNLTVAAHHWRESNGTVSAQCTVPGVPITMWTERAHSRCDLSLVADFAAYGRVPYARPHPPRLSFEFMARFPMPLAERELVPDTMHAVFIGGGAPLSGLACLSLLSAALVWNPARIFLHVDVLPQPGPTWDCARMLATVRVHGPPSAAELAALPGVPRGSLRSIHRSDILRTLLLYEEGGIYLDADAFALGPLGELRRYEFTMPYDGTSHMTSKLNNGIMLGAPRARFCAVLLRSYARWDGSGLDTQSCRVPFGLAVANPGLVHVENYPERTFADGGFAPPRVGLLSDLVDLAAHADRAAAFDGCVVLHLSGMGSGFKTAKNQARKRRGDLHFILANALARMAAPAAAIRALDARPADASLERRGRPDPPLPATPADRLCEAVRIMRQWLRHNWHVLPPADQLPAPSAHAPAQCAQLARERYPGG